MALRDAGVYLNPLSAFYVVSPALILYDILLTLPQEVHCIWRRKFSAVTILYGIIRYGTLLQVSLQFFWAAWIPTTSFYCQFLNIACLTMDVLEMITIALFSFLRVGAITGFKLYYGLPFLVLSTGFMAPAVALYLRFIFPGHFVLVLPNYREQFFCDLHVVHLPADAVLNSLWLLPPIARATSMLSDILVVGITWKKMRRNPKIAKPAGKTMSLTSIFLGHGNIYFCAIFAINIPCLYFHQSFSDTNDGFPEMGLPYFQYSVTAILISRFILELRNVDSQPIISNNPASSISHLASQMAGELGAPLEEQP